MYHLCKQTRIYDGHPYCGPTSNGMPAQYDTLEEAKKAQAEFNERNPVGWNIYDEDTGKLIDGVDVHGEMSSNVEFSGTPAALSPEAPLERRVGGAVPPAPTFGDKA